MTGKAVSLTNLMALDGRSWSESTTPGPNYDAAGSLAYFCMEGDNRSYRLDFVDFLRDSYHGKVKHELWDYLGMGKTEFVAAYEAWLRK